MEKKRVIYFGGLLILTILVGISFFSYAFFTEKREYHGKLNIKVGTLDYKIDGSDVNNNIITVNPTTDKVYIIKLTSLNNIRSKYSLYYENMSGLSIGYDTNYGTVGEGAINANDTLTIGIRIINNSSDTKNVKIGVEGGFVNEYLTLSKTNYVKINQQLSETVLGKTNRTIDKLNDYYKATNPSSLLTLNFPQDYSTIGITDIDLAGNAYIKSDGRIGYQVVSDNNCIVKRYDLDNIEILNNTNNICSKPIYKNMMVNGYGEYGDNTNFTSLTYDATDGSFYLQGNKDFLTNKLIPMDVNKSYYMAVDVKSVTASTLNYAGYGEYDYDKQWISPMEYEVYPQTLTTLARDLHKGDKEIYFTDLSKWVENTVEPYRRGIQVWGYTDGSGYTWPANTYSRYGYYNQFDNDGLDKTNNKIILRDQVNGWQGENFPAGTQVSQKSGSWGYTYNLVGGIALSAGDYQHYENVRSTHRYGSHYMKFVFLFRGDGSPERHIKNIVFEEVD